jgi:hypothetical protein
MHGNLPFVCEFGRALFLNARWHSSRIFRWGVTSAQQSDRMRRIGVLMAFDENDPRAKGWLSNFTQGLLNWVGQTAVPCGWTFVGPPAVVVRAGRHVSNVPTALIARR